MGVLTGARDNKEGIRKIEALISADLPTALVF
jgi:hypothetical protein